MSRIYQTGTESTRHFFVKHGKIYARIDKDIDFLTKTGILYAESFVRLNKN